MIDHVGTTLLRGGILGLLLVGLWRRNAVVVANAAVALGATLIPAGVEVGLRLALARSVVVAPEVALWIAIAGFLHTLGMVGLYESTRWWDHLTHTVSAAIVAAAVYAGLVAVDGNVFGGALPGWLLAGTTLLYTLSIGVVWELFELVSHDVSGRIGIESMLIPYGRRDAALDLVFDGVGALAVVALDVRALVPVAARIPRLAGWLLLAGGVVTVIGSLGMVGFLLASRGDVGP